RLAKRNDRPEWAERRSVVSVGRFGEASHTFACQGGERAGEVVGVANGEPADHEHNHRWFAQYLALEKSIFGGVRMNDGAPALWSGCVLPSGSAKPALFWCLLWGCRGLQIAKQPQEDLLIGVVVFPAGKVCDVAVLKADRPSCCTLKY